ncbi:PREDICTED: uncharacterized protein K02A2.6-like [Acropora digitifera]|uniref:uncharacterized protein K02A2.6-like n=1 Tax=Acropora digitifera TaxID=70779 RepID=UPI00077ACD94|nr:PREDICTED: uncharacterized protein K02A2.6-like [Acropora digitifera]
MSADVKEAVVKCEVCAEFQSVNECQPMLSHPISNIPWSRLSADHFTLRSKQYIVLVDHHSDYIEVSGPLKETTSSVIIKFMKQQFTRHGIKDVLVTDHGPQYVSKEFQEFSKESEFIHVSSSPNSAKSNGKAESAVKIVKKLFKKASRADQDPWLALLDYRNTPTTGMDTSPVQRLMSRRTKTRLPTATALLQPEVHTSVADRLRHKRQLAKTYHDRKAKELPDLEIGQGVRVAPYLQHKTWQTGVCVDKLSDRSYLLQCQDKVLRQVPVSGKRHELIKRVNDYINSGLEKNLVDPDGGLNIKKKRLKLGLEREVEPVINVEFPSEGFQVGVSCLPKIGYSQIWKYLIEEVEFKKQLSVEKPIVKGYNFFKSGKVLGLYSKTDNVVFYVKSQVMPSYSTSGPVYAVKVILSGSAEIKKAYCPCPAGSDGRCNHLAATLFAIEDLFTKATNSAESSDVRCTSKPCTWNVPKKRKLEATTIQSVKFEKHILGKEKRERKASIEVTGKSEYHQQTKDDSEQLLRNVREVEQKTGKKLD